MTLFSLSSLVLILTFSISASALQYQTIRIQKNSGHTVMLRENELSYPLTILPQSETIADYVQTLPEGKPLTCRAKVSPFSLEIVDDLRAETAGEHPRALGLQVFDLSCK